MNQTPRDWAFCNHTILQRKVFAVNDLTLSSHFMSHLTPGRVPDRSCVLRRVPETVTIPAIRVDCDGADYGGRIDGAETGIEPAPFSLGNPR
jgi:hypothetical protein